MNKAWILHTGVFATAVVFLSGNSQTCLTVVLFCVGIVTPCWILLRGLCRRLMGANDCELIGAVFTIVMLVPLYLLRKIVPIKAASTDVLLVATLWVIAWRTGTAKRAWLEVASLTSDRSEWIWLAVVLPLAFCMSWLGYEVTTGNSVRFYGLHFVDFAALVSFQNLVQISPFLPMMPVVDAGALSYHWFYFAVPAWMSEFLLFGGRPSNVLVLTNLFTSAILFLGLVRICRRRMKASGWHNDATTHLCGLSLFGLSTLYAYQFVLGRLHIPGLSIGSRNHLLLQLPHSLTCFGNNTFALLVVLLVIEALLNWSKSGRVSSLCAAASMTAILPAYSATLVLPVALCIVVYTLTGLVRHPIVVLGTFGALGLASLLSLHFMGLFGYGRDNGTTRLLVSYDGGQYVQNVVCGFLPITFCVIIWFWKLRDREILPFLLLAASCLVVPSFVMTTGTLQTGVDLSMKTASLYLVALTPVCVEVWAWLIRNLRTHRAIVFVGLLLVSVGITNSMTYLLQYAVYRVMGRGGRFREVSLDHYRALQFVAAQNRDFILIDQFSIPFELGDPSVMFGAKRVAIPTAGEEAALSISQSVKATKGYWLLWQGGGFVDTGMSQLIAERADLLIAEPRVNSTSWRKLATFGNAAVYRSSARKRKVLPGT